MRTFRVLKSSGTAAALMVVAIACAADDVIININPDSGDSLEFSIPFDSLSESVDTIVVDGDTIILTVLDTVITPSDTVLVQVIDTVQVVDTVFIVDTLVDTVDVVDTVIDAGTGDTTFVLIPDSVIIVSVDTLTQVVVDTIVTTFFDTVVQFDTVFEERVDTVFQVDTIIAVDTVRVSSPELGFEGEKSLALEVGESRRVTVIVLNELGYPVPSLELTWLTENSTVATVDGAGTVTGQGAGSTNVFAIADMAGLSATLPVQVSAGPLPQGAPTPWFEETWNYSSTSVMRSDPNGWLESNGDEVWLSTGLVTPWGGTTAMLDTIAGDKLEASGEPLPGGFDLEFPRAGVDQPREIWVEVFIRFAPSWRTSWGGSGNPDHKTVLVQNQNSSHRWSMKLGNQGGNGMACYTAADGAQGPPLVGDALDAPSQAWDGEWHRARVHMKMASTAYGTDGSYTCWWDSKKVRSGAVSSGDAPTQYFEEIQLGRTLNQVPTQPIWLEYGRVRVFTTSPGWN